MPELLVQRTVRVVTADLAGNALAGGAGGDVSSYDATPGDGSYAAAPNTGAEDTFTPAGTATDVTVYTKTAAIEVRFSFDSGASYGGWIVLEPGVHSFPGFAATNVQIREDVDDGGGEYQVLAVL